MSCAGFDWKGHALGETPPGETERYGQHLAACEACHREWEGLQAVLQALKRLPEHEIPRRIAFVSDPVFEPAWWRRLLHSGPRAAFASAALLSAAIVAHAVIARPAAAPEAFERRLEAEIARRVPAAVEERLRADLRPALAQLAARIDGLENQRLASVEKKFAQQRAEDIRDLRGAFDDVDRRLSAIHMMAARYGGEE
jgi:anti-sigma factor RsiW